MHSCSECGQACCCHGDIDDCVVETEEYSYMHCTCCGDDGCAEDEEWEEDGHQHPNWSEES